MGVLIKAKKVELAAIYQSLNPVKLLEQIDDNLKSLWRLAVHHETFGNQHYDGIRRTSVTVLSDATRVGTAPGFTKLGFWG